MKSIFNDSATRMWSVITAGACSLFLPILPAILSLFVVILIDAYYGCKVARKYNQCILSKGFRWTMGKFRDAMLLIMCATIIDKHIVPSVDLHLVEFIAGGIAFNEGWSILESLMDLKPKGPWRLLRNIIRAKGEKYLDINIDDKDLGLPQKRHYKLKNSFTKCKKVSTGTNESCADTSILGVQPPEAGD